MSFSSLLIAVGAGWVSQKSAHGVSGPSQASGGMIRCAVILTCSVHFFEEIGKLQAASVIQGELSSLLQLDQLPLSFPFSSSSLGLPTLNSRRG